MSDQKDWPVGIPFKFGDPEPNTITELVAEARKKVILEYMKLGPSIFDSTYEIFSKPGVTFTDEQKQAIQERIQKEQE